MADDFIRFAFTGGVFSRSILGRSDVEKYDLGLAEGLNWFIHYQGGASTRPGTVFLDYLQDDDKDARLAEFKFSSRLADTYLLVFTKDRLRFMQNGAYVLEAAKSVTGIAANTFTCVAHGFLNNDWVKIPQIPGAGTYQITNKFANSFQLLNPDGSAYVFTGTYNPATTVSRIYTLAHPYAPADLPDLLFSQTRDQVTITHLDYPPYRLSRFAATNWTLAAINLDGNTTAPGALTLTAQVAGTSGAVYGVTAVNASGQESYLSDYTVNELTNNFTATAGSMKIAWTGLSGTLYYNVYRSIVFPVGTEATFAQELGLIGRTVAPVFIDANIVPDFTIPPPAMNNPFAQGKITAIDVTAAGAGYTKATATVTVTGAPGTGFVGKPIVSSTGTILGVIIINPGSGYVSPTVAFGGGGAGATATATAGAATGTFPRCSTLLQQRRIYAGTDSQPMTLFASRPGLPDNFSSSLSGTDADSFVLTIDAPDVNPIKYCLAFPSSMLAFTENAVWQIKGAEMKAVTGASAIAEPISGTGIADVPPMFIEDEVLYLNSAGSEVRLLRPEARAGQAQTANASLYSSDFFDLSNIIESWGFAKEPYRLLWAQRKDGTFLSLTYMPDQNVYAWSNHETKGLVYQITGLSEKHQDRIYMIVQRLVGGVWKKYVERLSSRSPDSVEGMISVDAALTTSFNKPAATINFTDSTAVTDVGVFALTDVGSHIRAGNGRAIVLAYTNSTHVTIGWQIANTERYPQTAGYRTYSSGQWSLDKPFTTVSGLNHLEGRTVDVLADGNVLDQQTVVGGSIPIPGGASFACVGLPFDARLKTLPLHASDLIIAAKGKRIVGAALRLLDSRGLKVGDGDTRYEMKDRTFEQFDEPTWFQNGLKEIAIASSWEFDGSLVVEKTGPLNATLLGLVLKAEKSDD